MPDGVKHGNADFLVLSSLRKCYYLKVLGSVFAFVHVEVEVHDSDGVFQLLDQGHYCNLSN